MKVRGVAGEETQRQKRGERESERARERESERAREREEGRGERGEERRDCPPLPDARCADVDLERPLPPRHFGRHRVGRCLQRKQAPRALTYRIKNSSSSSSSSSKKNTNTNTNTNTKAKAKAKATHRQDRRRHVRQRPLDRVRRRESRHGPATARWQRSQGKRQCLSYEGSGNARQRQRLSHESSGNAGQKAAS